MIEKARELTMTPEVVSNLLTYGCDPVEISILHWQEILWRIENGYIVHSYMIDESHCALCQTYATCRQCPLGEVYLICGWKLSAWRRVAVKLRAFRELTTSVETGSTEELVERSRGELIRAVE